MPQILRTKIPEKTFILRLQRKYATAWTEAISSGKITNLAVRALTKLKSVEIFGIANFAITWGYYFGVHPFKWDLKASKIVLINEKLEIWRYLLVRLSSILCLFGMLLHTLVSITLNGLQLYEWSDILWFISLLLFILAEVLHFNTMMKRKLIMSFFNGFTRYFKEVESNSF